MTHMSRIMNMDLHFLTQVSCLDELTIKLHAQNGSVLHLNKLQIFWKD
jgi:hypothetical protein